MSAAGNTRTKRRGSADLALLPRPALILIAIGVPLVLLRIEYAGDDGMRILPTAWVPAVLLAVGALVAARRHDLFYLVLPAAVITVLGEILGLGAERPQPIPEEFMPGMFLMQEAPPPPLRLVISEILSMLSGAATGGVALLVCGLTARRAAEPLLLWIGVGSAGCLLAAGLLAAFLPALGLSLVLGLWASATVGTLLLCALLWRGGA